MAVDFKDVEDNSSHILSEKLKYTTPPIPVSFRLLWLSPSLLLRRMFCTHLTDERRAAQTREEDTKEHWALQSKEDVGEDDRGEGDDIFFEKKNIL